MASVTAYNKNNSAVKRILQEARELQRDDSHEYSGAPREEDIFEWHCTIRGPAGTEFEGGLYHCRIQLPAEYPFRAPSVMVLTPNGRFELNKKICISFTSYHEEMWQPAWGVRTVIVGLQGFFPHKGEAAVGIGALEYPISERKRLAALSREWVCPDCGKSNLELLPDPPAAPESAPSEKEEASSEPLAAPVTAALVRDPASGPEHTAPAFAPIIEEPTQTMLTPHPEPAPASLASVPQPAPTAQIPPRPPIAAPASANVAYSSAPTQAAPLQPLSARRPPLILDATIAVLLAVLLAIISRRL
ncbi:hypothetical protein BOTBODRAFT_185087 [Botryobasidium botryosum FD-172 SS1]|uniref:UBC core domain-containing protein n=1 Tax=Botryobasidium botryosum (strain FD-172 SS1) TaxID=930990 RepID=A0A067MRY6_BOTB1|nr:hypothetical protein BOTBODRAFT_185087 [Botryobasidium botryosum FD-172 SS1]